MSRFTRLAWAFATSLSILPFMSHAQIYTAQEAGVGIVSETHSLWDQGSSGGANYAGAKHIFAGPLGRYTWNLSPSLALEGSAGYLPGFQSSYGGDNGHELLALGGVKAGWRRRRFGVYGKLEPGIASFTPGFRPFLNQPTNYQRRTEFTLDYGGVFEWYPTQRTILRFDISQTALAEFDQTLTRFAGGSVVEEGHVAQHLGLGLSVAHRFGVVREEVERVPERSPVDLGILFALQPRQHLSISQLEQDRGGGAWTSYNFSRFFALDGTAFYEPHNDGFIGIQDGGTTFEVFAGVKIGIRRDRMGYFIKIRPGFVQFSRTIRVQRGPLDQVYRKATYPSLDTGGILEMYPSRHTILRIEGGGTSIGYQAADVLNERGSAHFPPISRGTILLLFGAGWRF